MADKLLLADFIFLRYAPKVVGARELSSSLTKLLVPPKRDDGLWILQQVAPPAHLARLPELVIERTADPTNRMRNGTDNNGSLNESGGSLYTSLKQI